MVNGKQFAIGILTAIVLMTLVLIPLSSQQGGGTYDPWIDTNDNGIIDIYDLKALASAYGTSGTPINKTALLLELQSRVDSLNASLLALQSKAVQLYQTNNGNWGANITSDTWTQVGNLAVTFTVDYESILIMTANGHIRSFDPTLMWLYASFFVDGNLTQPGGWDWGLYHIYSNSTTTGSWLPFTLTQHYSIPPGTHTVTLRARIEHSGATWYISGAAIQVTVIPV